MNTILHKHTPEILSIAHENHVGYDIACQMFINNIDDVNKPDDQYTYPGADELDYKALQKEIPAQGTQERADMVNAWKDDYDSHMAEIVQLNADGEHEAIRKLMVAAAENR